MEKIVVAKILLSRPNLIGSISKILQHRGAIIERGGFQFVSDLENIWIPDCTAWSENAGNIELRALALLGFIENKILAVQKF